MEIILIGFPCSMKLGKVWHCSEGFQMFPTHGLAIFIWVSVDRRCCRRDSDKNAAGYQKLAALIQIRTALLFGVPFKSDQQFHLFVKLEAIMPDKLYLKGSFWVNLETSFKKHDRKG